MGYLGYYVCMSQQSILVVEDNAALRQALQDMLTLDGFQVLVAENGRKALEQMRMAEPDLILSDVSMPEMDGFEFFEAVRENDDWISIPFLFLTARSEREDVLRGKDLGAEDYLVKPVNRMELLTVVRSRLVRSHQLRLAQLKKSYEASLIMLANAIDLRDRYTRGHVERVTAYSLALAKALDWPAERLEPLRYGAILHDIGKIHIRESTLRKSGPLTQEEWEEIRQHPIIGAEMIKDIPFLAPAVPAVRHHHEHWDGSGYPYGLTGEEIPSLARIITVADAFDAITTNRAYRSGQALTAAYDEILSCSDNIFDPQIVEAFDDCWQRGEFQKIATEWDVVDAPPED